TPSAPIRVYCFVSPPRSTAGQSLRSRASAAPAPISGVQANPVPVCPVSVATRTTTTSLRSTPPSQARCSGSRYASAVISVIRIGSLLLEQCQAGVDDRAQFREVLFTRVDERRPHPAHVRATQPRPRLDQGDRVSGDAVPQPHQR